MHNPSNIYEERYHLEGLGLRLMNLGGIVGVTLLVLAFITAQFMGEYGNKHFFFSYLISFCYFLSISLGCFFFVALQHITKAGWSVAIRRIPELLAANIPLLAILFIPIMFGMGHLYIWTDSEVVAHDYLLQGKKPYLNIPFFLLRCVLYFAVWWFFTKTFLSRSLEQDQSGDIKNTLGMERISPLAILFFALTITFASFDLIMSLAPIWFSTIFGVYFFAGSMLATFSIIILIAILLQRNGRLVNSITVEHYHDLGKFLFGFTFFWGYIAFSQYMLIWYGNIPEETAWYLKRQSGQWLNVSMFLLFFHLIIPFVCLLSRVPKRNKFMLSFFAVWFLVMHYVDLFWLIKPEFGQAINEIGIVHFSVLDILCFFGMAGLFIYYFAKISRGNSLIPLKDPRLSESLKFENF